MPWPLEIGLTAVLTAKLFTSEGEIEIKLTPADAPKTVSNFVELVRAGFYTGSIFDRAAGGVFLQGGGAKGRPGSGPGYCTPDEMVPSLHHDRAGVVSMASPGPNMNGSRFQITLGPAPALDERASIFGEVTNGLDVVRKLAANAASAAPKGNTAITKIEIEGEFTPTAFEKTLELDQAALGAALDKEAHALVAAVSGPLKLAKVKRLTVVSGKSRCADAQVVYEADFGEAGKGRLLLFAKSNGGRPEIRQMQFEPPPQKTPAK